MAPITPGYRLSTRGLPAKDQLAHITREMQPFARKVSPLAGRSPQDGFYSDISGYFFEGLPILDVKSDGYTFLPPEKKDPSLTDSYPWILMIRRKGQAEYVVDGQRLSYRPGQVNIRTPDNQSTGTLTDSETLMFYLEPDHFGGLEDRLNWMATAEGARAVPPLLEHYLAALGQVLPKVSQADVPALSEATLSMIRACISRRPDEVAQASQPLKATRLEIARKHVDAHLNAPDLSPDHIRAMLGLSKRRMQDLFDEHGGAQNFIRARRLKACFRDILASRGETSVAAIAEGYGFSNSAHFSRVFKAHFGWSPSDVKDVARRDRSTSSYETWLKGRE